VSLRNIRGVEVHLHTSSSWGVDGGKWLGLHLGCLNHGSDSGTFWIWVWVSPRDVWYFVFWTVHFQ